MPDHGQTRASQQVAQRTFDGLSGAALRRVWEHSPVLIAATIGPEHILVYQNTASRRLFGQRQLGLPLARAFPEITDVSVPRLTEVLRTGEPVDELRHSVPVPDIGGGQVVLRYVLSPLAEHHNEVAGVVMTAVDITAEIRAEEAAARSRLLSDLTSQMTAAGDAGTALRALTEALVPAVADLAAVYVSAASADNDPTGPPVPPEVLTMAPWLSSLGPPPQSRRREVSPWDETMRAGVPLLLPVNPDTITVLAPDPPSARWLSMAEGHTIAVLPLVVAGILTGALVLLAAGEREVYRSEDLPFLSDIAIRAGASINHLYAQQRERSVALQLQRALLPAAPPSLPGVTVAARYQAGAPEVEVGGDWWDVNALAGGKVALGIGDVSGRGVSAAAVMGQARAAMHAAGYAGLPPIEVLQLLDAQLSDVMTPGRLDRFTAPRFATACYAVLDPDRGQLRVSNAGHLPFLIRSAGGAVRVVQPPPGAPLGMLVGGFVETEVPIAAGDTVAMFTDGLVENRYQEVDDGIAKLAAAFEMVGGEHDLEQVAEQLVETVAQGRGADADDIALILARVDCAGAGADS